MQCLDLSNAAINSPYAILFGTDRFPFPSSNRLSRRHPHPLTRIRWTSSYMQAVFYRLSPYLVFGIMLRHRRDAPLYLRPALTRVFPYMARTFAYMMRDLPQCTMLLFPSVHSDGESNHRVRTNKFSTKHAFGQRKKGRTQQLRDARANRTFSAVKQPDTAYVRYHWRRQVSDTADAGNGSRDRRRSWE